MRISPTPSFTLNDTAQTLTDMNILDMLPYSSDLKAARSHGSYTVDTVTSRAAGGGS